jgi:hypothetical protein
MAVSNLVTFKFPIPVRFEPRHYVVIDQFIYPETIICKLAADQIKASFKIYSSEHSTPEILQCGDPKELLGFSNLPWP